MDPVIENEPGNRPGISETVLSDEYVAAHVDIPATTPSGGDFHATVPLDDGSGDVAIIMGDVAGHGPEQTSQAHRMRDLLADELRSGTAPAEALQRVNTIAEHDQSFETFGTVFVGTLEAGTGKLTYSNGGHEPALLAAVDANRGAVVQELAGTGPPVGAFPPEVARFDEHEATLPVDGTLLVYTDGLTDASAPENHHDRFGLKRLKRTLAQIAARSPGTLIARLIQNLTAFCRGRFRDDILVMAVRRRKPAKTNSRARPS